MGTDNLNKRRSKERRERKSKELETRTETWLIVCEGKKTEPNYFKALFDYINSKSNKKINVKIKGIGKNTKSVVNSVDFFFDYSDQLVSNTKIPYGNVFTVFDKDSFTDDNFNSAIIISEKRGFIPLWSNECFELWYILHYEYFHSNISRKEYFKKLTLLMGEDYTKNDNHFDLLGQLSKVKIALKNSKKLYEKYNKKETPSKKAPCTTMFKLFDEIEYYLCKEIKDIL